MLYADGGQIGSGANTSITHHQHAIHGLVASWMFSNTPNVVIGAGDIADCATPYAYGVDVVLNGPDHDYERFAPQDPDGKLDPVHGIREFVVGTGGAPQRLFRSERANSEARQSYLGCLEAYLARREL